MKMKSTTIGLVAQSIAPQTRSATMCVYGAAGGIGAGASPVLSAGQHSIAPSLSQVLPNFAPWWTTHSIRKLICGRLVMHATGAVAARRGRTGAGWRADAGLFKNPLASPIFRTSTGAALVRCWRACGLATRRLCMPLLAFLGALMACSRSIPLPCGPVYPWRRYYWPVWP